jgi:hypothetical protein
MGIDQYGQTYHNLGKYPRKELLERLGYKNAKKMYSGQKRWSNGALRVCDWQIMD